MSQRARSVGRDPLKRRRTHVYTGNRILIVTEGEKTEPLYLKKLRALLELNSAQVEVIHPEGTDPMTLVDYAIDRLATSRKQAKRGEDVAFDEAWVVFDLEQIHDERRDIAARARDRAEKHHIKVASSDPSFEFWLLLHFRQTTRPYPDCDSVTKDLRGCWPKYKKCSPRTISSCRTSRPPLPMRSSAAHTTSNAAVMAIHQPTWTTSPAP